MADPILTANKPAQRSTIIYGLCDPETGELRYVGKTSGTIRKRMVSHVGAARLKTDKRHSLHWIKSILDAGQMPDIFEIEIVPAGGDWQEAEMFWIAMFRSLGARLTNSTLGGDGALGAIASIETRAKLSAIHKGREFSDSHKKALSDSRTGMKFSDSHLAAMAAARLGKKHKPRSRGMSDEQKQKLRESALRQWADPAALAHISEKRKGVACTDSAKLKIGQKSQSRWDDPAYKARLAAKHKEAWADPEYKRAMLDARAKAKEIKQQAALIAN